MTKELQEKLLYHLNLLKTIGYNYCEPVDIKNCQTENFKLPDNLNDLKQFVENCSLCDFSKSKIEIAFSQGNTNAKIIFIDQLASNLNDNEGKLILGKSGELLINMIEKVVNVDFEEFYFTNIIKCKSHFQREPNLNEINSCKSYLLKQIEIIKPKLIVTLGEESFFSLTNIKTPIEEIRGKITKYNGVDLLPIYHPSYLLRNPSAKKEAYIDMLKIKSLLENM